MPATLEVYDRWRSSTPSLASPILFDMCGVQQTRRRSQSIHDHLSPVSITDGMNMASPDSSSLHSKGALSTTTYNKRSSLIDEYASSCDSSLAAWSEDGHRDHIRRKKSVKKEADEGEKRRRRSAVIRSSRLYEEGVQDRQQNAGALILDLKNSKPLSFNGAPRLPVQCVLSPGQASLSEGSPFASPLARFPTTPARRDGGDLIATVEGNYRKSEVGRPAPSPLRPRASTSPVPSLLACGWTVEKDEGSVDTIEDDNGEDGESAVGSQERTTAMIDNLLHGVQHGGLMEDDYVASPSDISSAASHLPDEDQVYSDDSSDEPTDDINDQAGWETESCEMTPRLRSKWSEPSSVDATTVDSTTKDSALSAGRDAAATVQSQPSVNRRASFLKLPPTIFPHTPAMTPTNRRQSILQRPVSISSLSSTSSRRSYRRSSRLAHHGEGLARPTARSRPMSRKSKYYSKPLQPGQTAPIKKQHLQGARGKFWSPMNSVCLQEDALNVNASGAANRQSTRYSRRSGQAWVRPRTFEVKDQYRVTIYPPQVDTVCEVKSNSNMAPKEDLDKTPTQATFLKLEGNRKSVLPAARPSTASSEASVKTRSRSSSLSTLPAPLPPPTSQLPPVPLLNYEPKNRRSRSSMASSCISDNRRSLTCSDSASQVETCTCTSCMGTVLSDGSDSQDESDLQSESDSKWCSCADPSSCSCTVISGTEEMLSEYSASTRRDLDHFERAGKDSFYLSKAADTTALPRSAPLYAPVLRGPDDDDAALPRSAPSYSSMRPPTLDPVPHFSPFYIDFKHLFISSRRLSKALSRYSSSTTSSCLTGFSSPICTCSDCQIGESCSCTTGSSIKYLYDYDDSDDDRSTASYDSMSKFASSQSSEIRYDTYDDSEESDSPLTPPRSEYMPSELNGYAESPGTRMSFIVSPMPRSAKRFSELQEMLALSPPPVQQRFVQIQEVCDEGGATRHISSNASVSNFTSASSTTGGTLSPNGTRRIPRSILKSTSKYQGDVSEQGADRRPAVAMSMAANTMANSSTSIAPHRITLATANPLSKSDLEGRIHREENRRKRNESRLYALEKLEGKTKKSSLFFSLLSNSTGTEGSCSSTGGGSSIRLQYHEWEEDEESSPLPRTPLTPTRQSLYDLQRQLEKRQRVTQFQNNKAVSFTDVIGFDMGTYPRLPARKKSSDGSEDSSEQDAVLKLQLKKLSTAIEARQLAKDKCLDK